MPTECDGDAAEKEERYNGSHSWSFRRQSRIDEGNHADAKRGGNTCGIADGTGTRLHRQLPCCPKLLFPGWDTDRHRFRGLNVHGALRITRFRFLAGASIACLRGTMPGTLMGGSAAI